MYKYIQIGESSNFLIICLRRAANHLPGTWKWECVKSWKLKTELKKNLSENFYLNHQPIMLKKIAHRKIRYKVKRNARKTPKLSFASLAFKLKKDNKFFIKQWNEKKRLEELLRWDNNTIIKKVTMKNFKMSLNLFQHNLTSFWTVFFARNRKSKKSVIYQNIALCLHP